MNGIDAAFKMLRKVVPDLTPDKLLDGLKPDYDPTLTRDQNKRKMAKKIAQGKFGHLRLN